MKSVYIIISCLCLLITDPVFAQVPEPYGWYRLQSPINESLRKLYFTDLNNGWAASLSGSIIHTTNSGKTWQIQTTNVTTPIVDIFFLGPQKGWALTYPSEPPFGTSILKTDNGGLSWIKDSVFFENEIFSTVFFSNDSIGYVGGQGIKKTTDGGLTWFNAFIEPGGVSTLPVNKFIFYSDIFGYACGGRVDVAGVIWKTTDGGNNWSSQGLSPDQIYDIYIIDSLNAISLSGDPELLYPLAILRTSDAGINWSFTDLPFFGISYALDFINSNEGWAAAGYKFLFSSDGGSNWSEEFLFDSTIVYDLQFVDKFTGFACGENGVLLKFVSPERDLPDKPIIDIGQNFPNPFSEKTTFIISAISTKIDLPVKAKINLYDMLGNEVLSFAEQEFYSGFYDFTFNASDYNEKISSGVYILALMYDNTVISKKIIYMK